MKIRDKLKTISSDKNIAILVLRMGLTIITHMVEKRKKIELYNPMVLIQGIREDGNISVSLVLWMSPHTIAAPHTIIHKRDIVCAFLPSERLFMHYLSSVNDNKKMIMEAKNFQANEAKTIKDKIKKPSSNNVVVSLTDYKNKKTTKDNTNNDSAPELSPEQEPPEPPEPPNNAA